MKQWQSNAEWSDFPRTTDTHNTKEAAHAICKALLSDFNHHEPCPTRGYCTAAYVTKIED